MLAGLREGDAVVIWKLDRLGRSLNDLVQLVKQLREKKVDFVSLQDGFNTSTPQGRLFFHIGAAFAEFEREIIRERTLAGLSSAKARGRNGGWPKGLTKEAARTPLALWQEGTVEGKEKLVKMLFPEEIYFDKNNSVYRSHKVNGVFELTRSILADYRKNKNGADFSKEVNSVLVDLMQKLSNFWQQDLKAVGQFM